jgi:predicted hydrocarbon binding protein
MKHLHKWIESLMDNLDEHVDERTRVEVLENCGRSCIPQSFIKKAKDCKSESKDVKDFLNRLTKVWHHLQIEVEDVFVVYEKCYCPLVKDYDQKLSPSFCNCSRGWIKELFESALGRPIDVKLEKSIRLGDNICKFKVNL